MAPCISDKQVGGGGGGTTELKGFMRFLGAVERQLSIGMDSDQL